MDKPRIDTGLVYSAVADTLPAEGRDFKLDAEYDGDRKPKLVVTALTPLGKAWVPFLEARLTEQLKSRGVSASSSTDGQHEDRVTAERIRKEAETETNNDISKSIAEAESAAKEASEELSRLQSAQERGEGVDGNAMLSFRRKMDESSSRAAHLRRVLQQLAETRKEVDDKAIAAATEDAKNGKDWSFDMTAPLESLFDRQDVTQKMKSKESFVSMIAEHDVTKAELMERAVKVAKQYAISKNKKGE